MSICYCPSACTPHRNTAQGNTKTVFALKDCYFGRSPFQWTHINLDSLTNKIESIWTRKEGCTFFPWHLHWKGIKRWSFNYQCEQDEWLQPKMFIWTLDCYFNPLNSEMVHQCLQWYFFSAEINFLEYLQMLYTPKVCTTWT